MKRGVCEMNRLRALFRKFREDAHKRGRFRPLRLIGFILKWVVPLAYVIYIVYDPTEKVSWLKPLGMGLVVLIIIVYFFRWKKKLHDALIIEKTAERLDFAKMNSIRLTIYHLIDTVIKLGTLGILYWVLWQVYTMSQFTLILLQVIIGCEVAGQILCGIDYLLNIGQEQLDEEMTRK